MSKVSNDQTNVRKKLPSKNLKKFLKNVPKRRSNLSSRPTRMSQLLSNRLQDHCLSTKLLIQLLQPRIEFHFPLSLKTLSRLISSNMIPSLKLLNFHKNNLKSSLYHMRKTSIVTHVSSLEICKYKRDQPGAEPGFCCGRHGR